MHRSVGILILGAFLLTPSASAQVLGYVKSDPVDEYYVTGYFRLSGGARSIAWSEHAATEALFDPDPPSGSPDTRSQRYALASEMAGRTGDYSLFPPAYEFQSAPLEEALVLNASRGIRVDLYAKPSCPSLDVEVLAGGAHLAGGIWGVSTKITGGPKGYWYPRPPAGFGICPYRMHAGADELPAGTVITVRLHHRNLANPYTLSLDNPASVIMLPTYPAWEVPFRMPQLGAGASTTPATGAESGASGAGSGAPFAMLIGLLLLAPASSCRRHKVLGLLLLVAPLAGCFADPSTKGAGTLDDGAAGSARVSVLDDNGTSGLSNASTGAIIGLVSDRDRRPISDAHVALLEIGAYNQTDRYGRFQFGALPPTEYTLRVDRPGFLHFEQKVKVQAVAIVRLEIQMDAVAQTPGRHTHDYWRGGSDILLADEVVWGTLSCNRLTSFGPSDHCRPVSSFYRVPPVPGRLDQSLILPGTRFVDVTIRWDASSLNNQGLQKVGVRFMANGDPPYIGNTISSVYQNDTHLWPRGNGETVRIATNWEMTDAGHQVFSTWKFRLFIDSTQAHALTSTRSLVGGAASGAAGSSVLGPFTMTIRLHKGTVGLDPTHPDLWGGRLNTTLLNHTLGDNIRAYTQHSSEGTQIGRVVPGWRPLVVPPETTEMEFTYERSRTTAAGWGLRVKPANMPETVPMEQYIVLPPYKVDGLVERYRMTLEPGQADSPYAMESDWLINYYKDDTDAVRDAQDEVAARTAGVVQHWLTLEAFRQDARILAEDA